MTLLLALLACGPSPDDIARAIASANPVQREDGAKLARNAGGEAVEQALIAVLADPSEAVRLNAIESLAVLVTASAAPALELRLRDDPSPAVRRAAADALGRLGAVQAAPALVAYVQGFSDDDRDQLAGLWALGAVGGLGLAPADREAVMGVLVARREATKDRFVRYNASAALRTLR
jgi:HEAT repeat protein